MELVSPLPGGARNPVWLARRGDQRLVVRRSGRPPPSLDWELDLLDFLDGRGIGVPRTLPADDGRRHVDGVLVQRFVDGAAPQAAADWRRVVEALIEVHRLTTGWPQRPGFATSTELQHADRGGDVRLDQLPAARSHWYGRRGGRSLPEPSASCMATPVAATCWSTMAG